MASTCCWAPNKTWPTSASSPLWPPCSSCRALLSVLYWPTANRRGFIAGLLAGILVWLVTMLLPLVGNLQGFYIPLLNMIYVLDDTSWHMAAIASLAANVLMFTLISLFTNASTEEASAAEPARRQRASPAAP